MEKELIKYIELFKKLRRAHNKTIGKAPHKPILLLSIAQLIKNGSITSNRVFITSELVLAFKANWANLVKTKHIPNFSLPFFHLKNEPFWSLVSKPELQLTLSKSKSIKSFKNLNDTIAFAEISKDLFHLLKNEDTNQLLTVFLLEYYFESTSSYNLTNQTSQLELDIENQILNEDREVYIAKIEELQATLDENTYQEEIFVRSGIFKKTIPKIYNYQCCISDMKIESSYNAQMVDACHIIPFSISRDDTIPNGISLSPNLHRAYDRGLITINRDYIVRISPTVIDNNSVYSIKQFEGMQINLPKEPKNYPSPESLIWHTREIFKL